MKSEKIFESEKQKWKKLLKSWKLKAKFLILKTASEKLKQKFYDFTFQLWYGAVVEQGAVYKIRFLEDQEQKEQVQAKTSFFQHFWVVAM